MPGQGWLRGPARYAAALACVALAFSARTILRPQFGDGFVYSTFYPPVVLAAYFAGIGPAILAAVLSAALGYIGFAHSLPGRPVDPQAMTSLVFFGLTSAVDIYFITGMTKAMNALRMERARAEMLAEGHASLFREFNERASNHLQLVAALLQLQARGEDGADYSGALAEASKRTLLISQVHRSMQGEGDRDTDFPAFARQLLASCLDAAHHPPIVVEVVDNDIALPAEQAVSVAGVLFEWFSSVLAHHARLRADKVRVTLQRAAGGYSLRLWCGAAATGVASARPPIEDLPRQIVRALAGHLGGAFTACSGPEGVAFELSFPGRGSARLIAPLSETIPAAQRWLH